MTTWSDLDAELDRWQALGSEPTFWWRDDDAEQPTPALDQLLKLAEKFDLPVHLSVVPIGVAPDLAPRLADASQAHVLQHGFAHLNHEPLGNRASEVGPNRPVTDQLRDLSEGWQRLLDADLPNLVPGLVPPWNQIAATTLPHLPDLGYRVLTTAEATAPDAKVPGLLQIDIQVDPIRWKGGAHFRGTEKTLHMLVDHLARRRTGAVDRETPTGLLTHHLQTDEETWAFVDELLDRLTSRQATRWLRLSSMLEAA